MDREEQIELQKAKLIDAFTTCLNQFYAFGSHLESGPEASASKCYKCGVVAVKVPPGVQVVW